MRKVWKPYNFLVVTLALLFSSAQLASGIGAELKVVDLGRRALPGLRCADAKTAKVWSTTPIAPTCAVGRQVLDRDLCTGYHCPCSVGYRAKNIGGVELGGTPLNREEAQGNQAH